ncbi:Conserved membrane protein in copper uptake, YcnI [Microbacterium esteraromaticum]|uniref:Conserved membrane protein in copper uptake, YcnI n=1 Tax=Microbacterium esteraromaticum TaxID=57043 RepID=A0A1R4JJ31_9MICO|nr:YcnI family protein [Microbacterium esteraromaticum]SJN32019.1 Conserved membrane protein in copper uptake, YcnI [Microbacterium esteraromaticum]
MSITLRRGALVAALAAGIVIATPAVASAHVGVSPDAISSGTSTLLTFSFSHGCGESPTTALRITMPEGAASVSPTFDAAWDAQVEKGDDGFVSTVTFTAVRPVPIDLRGAVSINFRPAEKDIGPLVFPVSQICEEGSSEWVETAEEGQDPHDLDAPAPVVEVTAAADDAHGHDTGAASDDAPSDTPAADHTAPAGDAASADDAVSPVPMIVGSAGLVAGLVALVVSIAAYRRRRA